MNNPWCQHDLAFKSYDELMIIIESRYMQESNNHSSRKGCIINLRSESPWISWECHYLANRV